MYSYGLYPVVTKPSRFSEFNATLIDNIFTNEMTDTGIVSGLLITDVGDHLPVFTLCQGIDVHHSNNRGFTFIWRSDEQCMNSFKAALASHDWDCILQRTDVNSMFDYFVDAFTGLYNTHCPLKRVTIKMKARDKPWFTRGLTNACKKKNKLYKKYLSSKSKQAEDR